MTRTRIRDFHDDDLDGIIRLFEAAIPESATTAPPLYPLSEVLATCQRNQAVVAVRDEGVVGAAVGRAAHGQGVLVFFHVLETVGADPKQGTRAEAGLLDALERRLMPLGLGKLSMLIPAGTSACDGLVANGFEARSGLKYVERHLPVQRRELDRLKAVGGRILPRHLWDGVSGMQEEKDMLEDRLGRTGSGRSFRGGATSGGDALRSSGDGEDDIREGGGFAAGLAVRRGVPLAPVG